MYDTIIIALSLEHGISGRAIGVARKLMNEGGRMVAVHAHEPLHGSVSAYVGEDALRKGQERVRELLNERVRENPDVETVIVNGPAGRAVTEYAERIGADCIVTGSHKPDLTDYLLGSTSARIVRHATCSVHVLR